MTRVIGFGRISQQASRGLWGSAGLKIPTHVQFLSAGDFDQLSRRVVFLYGPPTNCYVAYTVIRRKIVFICSTSNAVYTVI